MHHGTDTYFRDDRGCTIELAVFYGKPTRR